MSYILDALNKSEQERERRKTPGLKNLRGEPPSNHFQLRHFIFLLALLTIFNSIVVFFYFGNDSEPEFGIRDHEKAALTGSLATVNAVRGELPFKSVSPPANQSPSFPAQVISNNTVAVSDRLGQVIPQLPDIQITAHIFSSDPALRMVNINGVSVREGDFVSNDLIVVEITESGVVMHFEGHAYVMDIVENWQNYP
jgi:hypothetical protein